MCSFFLPLKGGVFKTHYFKNIAELKRKEMSNRSIALTLNLARNTVNKAVKIMESSKMSYLEIENLNEIEFKETKDWLKEKSNLNT